MRICRKTSELKVVCNTFPLHNSTGTALANLCTLTHSLPRAVLVPYLQHSYLPTRVLQVCWLLCVLWLSAFLVQ